MTRGWDSEWLVSDPQGAFAMGTAAGLRTRKYHGFYLGIAGRSQTAFLADLEFECDGVALWPHLYWGPQGPLKNPNPEEIGTSPRFRGSRQGPRWTWKLPSGQLSFRVAPAHPGGIALCWQWTGAEAVRLKVRGFWAMRDLHALGGKTWVWRNLDLSQMSETGQGSILSESGRCESFCFFRGRWEWFDDSQWYQKFYYPIELERGYPSQEDLYSAGYFVTQLKSNHACEWVLSVDPGFFDSSPISSEKVRHRIFDFQLKNPAGIVAGFPWFGEWGRDTFVSLPGLVAAWIEESGKSRDARSAEIWVREIMLRWGAWIETHGCLPNVLETEGRAQWESCDATLWWCHSLTSLWSYSLINENFYPSLQREFQFLLDAAIDSIRRGFHPFLKVLDSGLLEVTGAHTSWMDARVQGQAVTPRLGCLPEVNALWFQALMLQRIWRKDIHGLDLAKKILDCREDSRPNFVFLHSIPLAPSFVLNAAGEDISQGLEADLSLLFQRFWTPVGLRTLSSQDPQYRSQYFGHPTERDAAYHQGPVWAWLGGQFQAARDRLSRIRKSKPIGVTGAAPAVLRAKMLPPTILRQMPILGHIAELFDGMPPFVPRGAPAQAWSSACWKEALMRREWKVDDKMAEIFKRGMIR